MEPRKITYSVSETARLLNVSKHLVYEAVRQRKLKVVHFGRRIIIPANSIKLLLGISEAEEAENQVNTNGHTISESTESH